MYRIGMIGDRTSVLGFRAVGFDVEYAENQIDAKNALSKLTKQNYGIIYITEQVFLMLEAELQKFKEMPIPAIIVLPNNRGSSGIGMKGITKSVERAVGADIFSESGDK